MSFDLTIAGSSGAHKPPVTVDVGDTAIADVEEVGRIGLRPRAIKHSSDVTLTLMDATVKPMRELEDMTVTLHGRPVKSSSRPALSITVLRIYEIK